MKQEKRTKHWKAKEAITFCILGLENSLNDRIGHIGFKDDDTCKWYIKQIKSLRRSLKYLEDNE